MQWLIFRIINTYVILMMKITPELFNLLAMQFKNTRSHYTFAHKISITNYCMQNSTNKAAVKFRVDRKQISKWKSSHQHWQSGSKIWNHNSTQRRKVRCQRYRRRVSWMDFNESIAWIAAISWKLSLRPEI